MKPRLLDAFSGAGGCARGYQLAGFYVVGVDIKPQPRYAGDEFVQGDALEFISDHGHEFDAIHASPPCQAYSSLRRLGKGAGKGAPDLVGHTRALLQGTGLPYVIENVMESPLRNAVMLCGSSFGLGVRRHRLFECSFPVMVPSCIHGQLDRPLAVYGDHPQRSTRESPNRARTLTEGQEAMGIDWMPWRSLTQAIPPAYTEHIGGYLLTAIEREAAA